MSDEGPTLAELIDAVVAEDGSADLRGALRRSGGESVVLETSEWIYRFPRPHVNFRREVAVLGELAGRLPTPIPRVEWTGRSRDLMAYRKIVGRPFDRDRYGRESRSHQQALAESMAHFLATMHSALTKTEIRGIGIPAIFPVDRRAALIKLDELPAATRSFAGSLVERARRSAESAHEREVVLLHNDFTSDNVVFDAELMRLAGVWDFSGVSVGEPAFDFRYLFREPDPLASDVLEAYENMTGRNVDREALQVAWQIGEIVALVRRGTPEQLVRTVRSWADAAD